MKLPIKLLTIIILFTVLSCNKTKEKGLESSEPKQIMFPKFNAQYSNKSRLSVNDKIDNKFQLDSVQYISWTDKYTPYKTEFGRLYSSYLYSVQPQIDSFAVLTLKTDADHWYKLHLVTLNKDLELVDQIQISEDWSDLLEQAGDTEVVGKLAMYANMISAKEYQIIKLSTTEIIDYYSDSTTYEIDSVVSKIELSKKGTFKLTKLDSIRKVTHSNNK